MSDAVERPPYYVFPNGIETIQLSQWLTSAGGQAVQYLARATRIDGVVKENPVEDLHKAAKWIQVEIERLESVNVRPAKRNKPVRDCWKCGEVTCCPKHREPEVAT